MANEVAGENFDTELLPVQSEDEIGVVTERSTRWLSVSDNIWRDCGRVWRSSVH